MSNEKAVEQAEPEEAESVLAMHNPPMKDPEEQVWHTYRSEHSEQFGMQAMQSGGVLAG